MKPKRGNLEVYLVYIYICAWISRCGSFGIASVLQQFRATSTCCIFWPSASLAGLKCPRVPSTILILKQEYSAEPLLKLSAPQSQIQLAGNLTKTVKPLLGIFRHTKLFLARKKKMNFLAGVFYNAFWDALPRLCYVCWYIHRVRK